MIKMVGIDSKNLRIKCARRFGSDGPHNIGMDHSPQECTHDTRKVLELYPSVSKGCWRDFTQYYGSVQTTECTVNPRHLWGKYPS